MDCSKNGHFVLSEKTSSQIDIHKKYGGVVPEIAGRMHAEKIVPLIEEVLKNQPAPEVIAVTAGPGLITGLIVGVEAARTLSYSLNIPLVAVNHIEGHIHSTEISPDFALAQNRGSTILTRSQNLDNIKYPISNNILYPAISLIASGGHTELILIKKEGSYKMLGATKDDAAGECFDKVAKLLDLPYPGGPQISKLAVTGNVNAIKFPRPMLDQENYDFSFSGLKTSALYWLRDNSVIARSETTKQSHTLQVNRRIAASPSAPRNDISINDFCASFEEAIVDVLSTKTIRSVEEYKPKTVIVGGGVSANQKLRDTLQQKISSLLHPPKLLLPQIAYAMDNAAMIAIAGFYKAKKEKYTDWKNIKPDPNWKIT